MKYKFLNHINSPNDLKNLTLEQQKDLCGEIRDCLISTVAKNGGHLASNLGAVELTVALHKAFDSPKDKIIFDVGHQCYTHKLLTGRFNKFSTIRTEDGLSGFMRPDESEHDPVITGHSSTSISSAFGIYKAAQLQNKTAPYVVSVVGDGAMTGGMVYEGLNNAGSGKNSSLIVVLNDNKMSISRNVGAFARYLSIIRSRPGYHRFKHRIERIIFAVPIIGKHINRNLLRSKTLLKNAIYHSNIFEDMGFNYMGPVDGHDLKRLEQVFDIAKDQTRPVLVHVLTTKGKGYHFAENQPKFYHGVSSFDIEFGTSNGIRADFSACVGDELCHLAKTDSKLCVITAAMTEGTGLSEFASHYKSRFFDVGIAEEHAVTFAGGLAAGGARPVFAVYSTFLQRAYDQIIHDTAIANLPVTICVDRAGFVGEDGETHQGLFDVGFLKTIPNMQIFSPTTYRELKFYLYKSIYKVDSPSALRYPRGVQPELPEDFTFSEEDYAFYGDCTAKTVIVTYGRLFANAAEAFNLLKKQGVSVAVLKLNKIFPLKEDIFNSLMGFKNILFYEEAVQSGGINETMAFGLINNGFKGKYSVFAVPNTFVRHAGVSSLLKKYGLDTDSMCRQVIMLKEETENVK